MTWTYFRLLYTVTFNPGYVPRGPQWYAQQEKRRKHLSSEGSSENVGQPNQEKYEGPTRDQDETPTHMSAASTLEDSNSEEFFNKSVYVCKGDGMPVWCSTCMIWKPDRTHHCREVDRCVRKMDHFCPWVGGVVSETSFNFFIQFTSWTAIFCIFNIIHLAVFMAEYKRKTGTADVHWIITLGLAALFALFTLGMSLSSLQFILVNTTTIENLSRKTIVWDLALQLPEGFTAQIPYPTVSFSPSQVIPRSSTNPVINAGPVRRYVILHSKPGQSPWDLGGFRNFQSVMGLHWYQWIFPLSYSPCCDHSRPESQFELGPVVDQMRKEAGIPLAYEGFDEKSSEPRHRRRRRRRRRSRRQRDSVAQPEQVQEQRGEADDGNDEHVHEPEIRDVADMV